MSSVTTIISLESSIPCDFNSSILELENKKGSLEEQISEQTDTITILKSEQETIEEKIAVLKDNHEKMTSDVEAIRDYESANKDTVQNLQEKIQKLSNNKISIEKEFNAMLEKTSESYYQYKIKNEELNKNLSKKEEMIKELTNKISGLQNSIVQFRKDIKSTEVEKEEHTNHISQLITMKNTYQKKIENLKQEFDRIEEVKFLELSTPKLFNKKESKEE